MESYFDYLPSELIEIILYYTDDYSSIVTLRNLSEQVLTTTNNINVLKRLLSQKLGRLVKAMNVDFSQDALYILASYIRGVNTYKETKGYLDHMIDETNKIVNEIRNKYLPNMDTATFIKEASTNIQYGYIHDNLNDYAYELNNLGSNLGLGLEEEIKNMIKRGYTNNKYRNFDTDYNDFLKNYSVGQEYQVTILLIYDEMMLIYRDIEGDDYFSPSVGYDDMLYILFKVNYVNGVYLVRNSMRRINEL